MNPNINFNGGESINNWANGSQNINKGRDQNLNQGTGTMNIYHGSDAQKVPSDANAKDKPLTSEKLQQELKSFLRLKLTEHELEKINAQMIISDLPGKLIEPKDRAAILDAMVRLSDISETVPKCLWVQDVGIKVSDGPLWETPSAEVFRGQVGDFDVAVKALKISDLEEEQVKTYMRQAIAWRRLEHTNVLSFLGLYYFDESRTRLCLVRPWIEPGTLRHYIDSNLNDSVQIEPLARGIVHGLQYLHICGITHGNLRGSNVLIDSQGVPRIADYGLRVLFSDKNVDLRPHDDIERFGRVCCEMFEDSPDEMDNIYMGGQHPDRPYGIPDPLWTLAEKCWNPNASLRPGADAIAAQGLLSIAPS
ncbi:hypothetical protein V5O48_003316 [Marasmius crinis-equi]|uniref:Protein kinase domain-containing protein n=1 Tax=Marasmius crinis-equi TaxID=585013 RepID=A0ABR3FU18_9AGAR